MNNDLQRQLKEAKIRLDRTRRTCSELSLENDRYFGDEPRTQAAINSERKMLELCERLEKNVHDIEKQVYRSRN